MTRLSAATLAALPEGVRRPGYDASRVREGIVHLGVGNFHRAHQAVYVDDALAGGEDGWGICGVSLRSPGMRDALAPQDGLYALVERDARDPAGRARVIGALRRVLVAPEDPAAVVDRIADPSTRIVTLTITEKGYCRVPGGKALDSTAPEVAHDLADPANPRSAVGLLHAAAARRMAARAGGFTVLSCDNLAANGAQARRLVLEFVDAAARPGAGALARWIESEVAFPDSMVDRIVPHTTDAHRAIARELLGGVDDAWPVVTEPFTQWVIQDRFAAGRPRWEDFGAQFVDDVAPWEEMKLRLLNAAHSCIAYLGVAAGLETVDAAVSRAALREFVCALWRDEVFDTLPAQVRALAPAYCESLLERFANPALGHRTSQIAMDGSQKLALRVLPSVRARIAAGAPYARLATGVAAWIRYLGGVSEAGVPHAVDDPMAATLRDDVARAGGDPAAAAAAVLRRADVFGEDLASNARFRAEVVARCVELATLGAIPVLERMRAEGGR